MNANIHNRAALERLYPRDAFESDANRNAQAKASVLYGLRILSSPDGDGRFEVARASQHVGEVHAGDPPPGGGVFLAPSLAAGAPAPVQNESGYGGPQQSAEGRAGRGEDYETFLDRVLATARSADFPEPIGRDERLKGFRGG